MESLIILIPLSIVLVAGAMAAFLWAVNSGQYDQLDRDAQGALGDGDTADADAFGAAAKRNARED